MDIALTDEQQLIERTTREYAERALAPRAAERDRTEEFPERELGEIARLGLMAINVPEELGGAGAGVVAYALAMLELSRGDPSVSVAVSVTNMVAELIARYGTVAQKREHIAKIVSGEYLSGALAQSETKAGADDRPLRTSATRTDTGWRLRGTKQWISSGDRAGIMVVWAVTGPAADGGKAPISAFLVRGGAPGLTVHRREEKMGLRGSSTVGLTFEDVEVGDDALLGEVGGGFRLAMTALDGGRLGVASQALGIARTALDAALVYARERETFGVAIAQHQAIGNLLADAATWWDAARLLVLRAAWRKEKGLTFVHEAAMAKLFATEKAGLICDLALQIHGGAGYTRDFPIERAVRDVRVTRIYEGTSEIQRLVIARQLIREERT
jgi:alkylation response protein AidB-like acyl-CoA dehydrogenase